MATVKSINPATVEPADVIEPNEFFSLGAKYLIEPGADLEALACDVSSLLGSGLELLEERIHNEVNGSSTPSDFGILYLLRQAFSVCEELRVRTEAQAFRERIKNAEVAHV